MVSERTRDKIHAARRRGKWTGGQRPRGYDLAPEGGRLIVNKPEGEEVLVIFRLFAENPSLVKVAAELNRRGWERRPGKTKAGTRHHEKPWNRINLRRLLTNPIYIGMITLGDETYRGEHDGIVPKKLFDQVQRLMSENKAAGSSATRNSQGFLLRGLLRCSSCDAAMTPSWTKTKRGTLYRYYGCVNAQKQGHRTCPTRMVKADTIEQFVVDQIRRIGSNPALQEETFRQAVFQLRAERRGLKVERKRIDRELATTRGEVANLVATLTRTNGAAAEAVQGQLAAVQKRVSTFEARQREIDGDLAALATQDVDQAAVARALAGFDELWSVLLVAERERVLRLLIERIDYRGSELTIHWRLTGLGDFAAEVNGGVP